MQQIVGRGHVVEIVLDAAVVWVVQVVVEQCGYEALDEFALFELVRRAQKVGEHDPVGDEVFDKLRVDHGLKDD